MYTHTCVGFVFFAVDELINYDLGMCLKSSDYQNKTKLKFVCSFKT